MSDPGPLHTALAARGLVRPVTPADEAAYLDCELAAFAENRLGDPADPRALDDARRADWSRRALAEPLAPLAARIHRRCYWLWADGGPVGTVSVSRPVEGLSDVYLGSFYLFPDRRGRGLAGRLFAGIRDAVLAHGYALRLDTCWTWPHAVRFWLSQGLWLYHWKRELTFLAVPELPPPRVEVGPRVATLAVAWEGRAVVAQRAWRRAGRLVLRQVRAPELALDGPLGFAAFSGATTLSLHLALAGWPLIRSREALQRFGYADGGAPEALMQRIAHWEGRARRQGWLTPPTRPA